MRADQATLTIPARAFWIAEPGRGEIREEVLAAPARRGCRRVRRLQRHQPGHRGAGVQRTRARERTPADAGAVSGRRISRAREIRIRERRPGRARPRSLPVATSSSCIPTRPDTLCRPTSVHLVPERVPPGRAVLAANLETAINGVWDARPHVGDRVAVIGAGTVGCLVAWLVGRIAGCEVELIDVNPRRDSHCHDARRQVRGARQCLRRCRHRDSRERIAGGTRSRVSAGRVRGGGG